MKKKFTWRKLFNDIHLWLGIASGLVLFVVCLSGTIYTFHTEIEELVEPSKFFVEAEANAVPQAPDVLLQQVEQELGGMVNSLSIPEDRERAYEVNIKQSEEERRGTSYFINPYTGEITGKGGGATSEFFSTVMRLHRWLLIEGEIGKIIVGVATIIFVFLVLTGLVLWFPVKLKNWKQGLKVKTNANWKRVNHDLHNTLGFYSFILLLIMALTGLCWSFGWYRDGLSSVMGAEVFKGRGEKPAPSNPAGEDLDLTVADFIERANALLPYEGDTRVALPSDSISSVVVSKNKVGFFALSAADKVQLDQYNGEPTKVEIFSEKPLNEQVVSLIKPLHLGEVYGTFSKILYFIACLIATSLPVTGTLIWINKLRKKPKGKARMGVPQAA